MKHKKKLIFSLISIVILVFAFVGGSLAYFTDSVESTNVIVAGSVSIKQYETDRNSVAVNYTNVTMLPAITNNTVTEAKEINGNTYNFNTYKNIIDKVVTLENDGKNDAYVRTIIAIPEINDKNLVGVVTNNVDIQWERLDDVIISGEENALYIATYKNKLAPREKSAPSLMQVYLSPLTSSADLGTITDGKIKIRVISQAMQYSGFEDVTAEEALNEGFGKITRNNHPFQ